MAVSAARSLRDVALFRPLSPAARAEAEQACIWRTIPAGKNIVHFQDETRDVYFLIEGRARVMIYSVGGKAVAFRELGPGDMFGELAAVDGRKRSATVEAIKTCVVGCMPDSEFRKLLRREPQVAEALLVHAIAQIRLLTARVFEFSTLAVKNRIQAEVLRLAQTGEIRGNSARIFAFPTHVELANRISTHREAVTRELARLTRLGLLRRNGSSMTVTDVERLARMVDDALGE
jgi:CRP-like cAMP-binding protein